MAIPASTMLINYLKTAFRNLSAHKTYALISIAGLGIGMSAFLVLFLVIRFETGFDTFHTDPKNIYRVVTVIHFPDGAKFAGEVPYAVPQGLRMDYPQLRDVTSLIGEYDARLQTFPGTDKAGIFKEKQGVFWTGPSFFRLFNFPLLAGDPATALDGPHKAVLTKTTAGRYFGSWSAALGKTLKAWNGDLFTVTGILKDPPANTDIPIHALLSYQTLQGAGFMDNWAALRGGSYCFLRLPEGWSPQQFDKMLEQFSHRHKPAEWQIEGHILQPLREMHFDPEFGSYTGHIFPRPLITGCWGIAVFLLLIACINFVNFSTARALTRSREVGIRKVLGGSRRQLIFQFLGEAALLSAAGILVALVLMVAAIPLINGLLDLPLSFQVMGAPVTWTVLPLLWLGVTLLSGIYPALVLSGFHPINTLKTRIATRITGGVFLRKALVVFQFTFVQLLIISIVVITAQMNFFRNAPLGFDKANILLLPIPQDSTTPTRLAAFRAQLTALPGVSHISFAVGSPADLGWQKLPFRFNGSPRNSDFDANVKWADTAYFPTYDLHFIAGGPYSAADTTTGYVVNETLLQKEHLSDPRAAIGKIIQLDGGPARPIVGVVRDFTTTSLRNPIDPVILSGNSSAYRVAGIKLSTPDLHEALTRITRLWQQTWPAGDLDYSFLDQRLASFYLREEEFARLFRVFTIVAILISCLGLYALAAFITARRQKEIAVRKVMGASVTHVVYRFVREFTWPVLLAFAIAAPAAAFLMRTWLDGYAYRIQLGPAIFIWSLLLSITIAWITVGGRVLASASRNPVHALRD